MDVKIDKTKIIEQHFPKQMNNADFILSVNKVVDGLIDMCFFDELFHLERSNILIRRILKNLAKSFGNDNV